MSNRHTPREFKHLHAKIAFLSHGMKTVLHNYKLYGDPRQLLYWGIRMKVIVTETDRTWYDSGLQLVNSVLKRECMKDM